ncbi:myosin/kinesin family protein [Thiorhodovibrio frisius]|uniref:hypothetical protein n=1 Tax=Thiorhodovibrio frisius TaxID=631362 RepID=UPI000255E742|nr:hypothetical protein [Thiorhodovibrio frisius]
MTKPPQTFASLDALAQHLREGLSNKYILLFAFNGAGKTRLSMAFKDLGKKETTRDTLYYSAFTEDLFTWNNDLEGDTERVLRLNTASRFFDGLHALEMESRIRPLLWRYADFDFRIDYEQGTVNFVRDRDLDPPSPVLQCALPRAEKCRSFLLEHGAGPILAALHRPPATPRAFTTSRCSSVCTRWRSRARSTPITSISCAESWRRRPLSTASSTFPTASSNSATIQTACFTNA